jgi:hypothetical protein
LHVLHAQRNKKFHFFPAHSCFKEQKFIFKGAQVYASRFMNILKPARGEFRYSSSSKSQKGVK